MARNNFSHDTFWWIVDVDGSIKTKEARSEIEFKNEEKTSYIRVVPCHSWRSRKRNLNSWVTDGPESALERISFFISRPIHCTNSSSLLRLFPWHHSISSLIHISLFAHLLFNYSQWLYFHALLRRKTKVKTEKKSCKQVVCQKNPWILIIDPMKAIATIMLARSYYSHVFSANLFFFSLILDTFRLKVNKTYFFAYIIYLAIKFEKLSYKWRSASNCEIRQQTTNRLNFIKYSENWWENNLSIS